MKSALHAALLPLLLLFAMAASLVTPTAARGDEGGLDSLVELLLTIDDASFQLDLLQGMHAALDGRRNVPAPAGWSKLYKKLSASAPAVQTKATELALIFGDQAAINDLKKVLLNASLPVSRRTAALGALTQNAAKGLAPTLHDLLGSPAMQRAALRGLSRYDDAQTPAMILKHYPSMSLQAKNDAITTLATRVSYAAALLDAVDAKIVPVRDVSAFHARQIESLPDAKLKQRLTKTWGVTRPATKERRAMIERYRKQLKPEFVAKGDLSHGRLLFARTCATCHTLFGEGGKIGPDLTGSNRNNLDYVLENVIDPSASVARDYQMSIVVTADGRIINGIIGRQAGGVVQVQTANEKLILDEDDIEETTLSPSSMMPDGLLEKLSIEEFRNLVRYLASPVQVQLPPGAKVQVQP